MNPDDKKILESLLGRGVILKRPGKIVPSNGYFLSGIFKKHPNIKDNYYLLDKNENTYIFYIGSIKEITITINKDITMNHVVISLL